MKNKEDSTGGKFSTNVKKEKVGRGDKETEGVMKGRKERKREERTKRKRRMGSEKRREEEEEPENTEAE